MERLYFNDILIEDLKYYKENMFEIYEDEILDWVKDCIEHDYNISIDDIDEEIEKIEKMKYDKLMEYAENQYKNELEEMIENKYYNDNFIYDNALSYLQSTIGYEINKLCKILKYDDSNWINLIILKEAKNSRDYYQYDLINIKKINKEDEDIGREVYDSTAELYEKSFNYRNGFEYDSISTQRIDDYVSLSLGGFDYMIIPINDNLNDLLYNMGIEDIEEIEISKEDITLLKKYDTIKEFGEFSYDVYYEDIDNNILSIKEVCDFYDKCCYLRNYNNEFKEINQNYSLYDTYKLFNEYQDMKHSVIFNDISKKNNNKIKDTIIFFTKYKKMIEEFIEYNNSRWELKFLSSNLGNEFSEI